MKKHSIAVIGLLTGLFGVGWSIYTEYFKRGEIAVSVVAEGAVLDVRRDLPDLVVLFRSEDLRASEQSLRFYSFVVQNTGSANITKNMFDERLGWGVNIAGAKFTRLSDFSASAPLLRAVEPVVEQPDKVRFQPAIFDSGDSFRFDVLVVHPKGQQPTISLIGGVSGNNFKLLAEGTSALSPFGERVFSGTTGVQIARVAAYGAALILCFAFGLAIAATVSSRIDARARHRWGLENLDRVISERKLKSTEAMLLTASFRAGDHVVFAMRRDIRRTLRERRRKERDKELDTNTQQRLESMEESIRSAADILSGAEAGEDRIVAKEAERVGVQWKDWLIEQDDKSLRRLMYALSQLGWRQRAGEVIARYE